MRRRVAIPTVLLNEALTYCKVEGNGHGERTLTSMLLVEALQANPHCSAEDLGKIAGCKRKHVFAVLQCVRARQFNNLVGHTFRRRAFLSHRRLVELKKKLGKQFFDAKQVVAWYESWSGKPASVSAAYKWCQTATGNAKPFRSLPKRPKTRKSRNVLKLTPAEVRRLEARRAKEVEADKIKDPKGFGSSYLENPALRITAILEYANSDCTLGTLSKSLGVDIGRWVRQYNEVKGDLDALCEVNGNEARERRGLKPLPRVFAEV